MIERESDAKIVRIKYHNALSSSLTIRRVFNFLKNILFIFVSWKNIHITTCQYLISIETSQKH